MSRYEKGYTGLGLPVEFENWWVTLPVGKEFTLKEMAEATGLPRGSVWAIKEKLFAHGFVEPSTKGLWKKIQ